MRMNIEAERARNGLSKAKLANILGVSRGTLRSWVYGASMPVDKLEKMANLFSCELAYLLKNDKTTNQKIEKIMNSTKKAEN